MSKSDTVRLSISTALSGEKPPTSRPHAKRLQHSNVGSEHVGSEHVGSEHMGSEHVGSEHVGSEHTLVTNLLRRLTNGASGESGSMPLNARSVARMKAAL